ncbi:MAG: (E)-4-hydroxy-3-methylbut-2-enyl-diphosphate synthase [Bacteroidales bacterium]|nr:(E)-4-hydroxy-3-methylbut-2-enyl-diphosphate synthase [Bacteroidales bacterium]
MNTPFQYSRRPSREVYIGDVPLGGDNPIRIQSMTNTDTMDVAATVRQSIRMIEAGCEYVRITTPNMKSVECLALIKEKLRQDGFKTPLIADVHFNADVAIAAARIADKIRINPGNYTDKNIGKVRFSPAEYSRAIERIRENITPLIHVCQQHGTALRIGSNQGSLSERIVSRYGDTPEGMVEAAMEFVRICADLDFHNLVLSMKSSNTRTMVFATRLLVQRMAEEGFDYPLHLGVTEAGAGEDGRIKSAVGIGTLLMDGIGDTIRVSLTETPENEIAPGFSILQAARARFSHAELISCPSCGRTQFDIIGAVAEIREKTRHLKGITIAVMGCIVNGPGEMAGADYGYVGSGKGTVTLFKGDQAVVKNIPQEEAVERLMELIKKTYLCTPKIKSH